MYSNVLAIDLLRLSQFPPPSGEASTCELPGEWVTDPGPRPRGVRVRLLQSAPAVIQHAAGTVLVRSTSL